MSVAQPDWKTRAGSQSSARKGLAVDLSGDTTVDLDAFTPDGVLVGVAGNIVGRLLDDSADITYPVPAGLSPLRFKIIRSTANSTTATGIVLVKGG